MSWLELSLEDLVVLSLIAFSAYRFLDMRSLVYKYEQNKFQTLRARPRIRGVSPRADESRDKCRRGKRIYYTMAKYNDFVSTIVFFFALCAVIWIGTVPSAKAGWTAMFSAGLGTIVSILNFIYERARALVLS
ncbi:hypothetical protein [Bradyrhizobium sp. HKCCYLS20291]|uniref:hypothetical protein n=1 Tax=Bradyrhizobium sp. HKCCYLS20291 TaxID=3420766 RepID=UPI003EBBB459